jgi:hypothetical protein
MSVIMARVNHRWAGLLRMFTRMLTDCMKVGNETREIGEESVLMRE